MEFLAASHEDPANPGALKKILVEAGEFTGSVVQMVNWARLPCGRSFNAHYHQDMQELFVMMQGRVQLRVDNQQQILEKGDSVLIDAGSVHRMDNIGDEDAEYLVVGVSAGRGGKTVVSE